MRAERVQTQSNESKVQQIRQVYKNSLIKQRRPKMRNRGKAESRYQNPMISNKSFNSS